ncbi:hypothetical protein CFE70_009137 [Pyrenophora teres f. teres 0-1]|uniref:Uncharacterized protein n=1 Tax=Pyrenophora teres f. teres TaxID=97479 RepID=A0A6S6WCH8_9PLEO|nr:hypothetical protein PTNB85_10330 [Pyrenophora teres f. teres]KAE8832076.1 hypothetical protein HRS9139_06318 [Pyrenophora teres f. teres]KAE8835191.1 hypothetical protein HRS9122_07461 [Pyrenophora teres f. teres]KAE8858089.1 hypothetical protein PTNB29_07304 [Pyrenophora teres f. teres]KAE8862073.1 hypothetical protein PTNB73_07627 [Pyrenophora teres f. teres]
MEVHQQVFTYLSAAIEECTPPPGETCSICQEGVEEPAPQYGDTSDADEVSADPVFIKVCGPKHFFHTACIIHWWCSGEPMLDTCPIDRAVAFDRTRVPQPPVDEFDIPHFLGHDIEEQDYARLAGVQLTRHERTIMEIDQRYERVIMEIDQRHQRTIMEIDQRHQRTIMEIDEYFLRSMQAYHQRNAAFDLRLQVGDAEEMPGRGYDEMEEHSGNAAHGRRLG